MLFTRIFAVVFRRKKCLDFHRKCFTHQFGKKILILRGIYRDRFTVGRRLQKYNFLSKKFEIFFTKTGLNFKHQHANFIE